VKDNRSLEERITEWRNYVLRRQALHSVDVEELEDHLRTQIGTLRDAGLDEDEAFLVTVKRLGDLDSISREFAQEYSERLWKQFVVSPGDGSSSFTATRNAVVAVGLAVVAAAAIKLPGLFGVKMDGTDAEASFYVRNLSLFVLPFLAGYFAWKRGLSRTGWCWAAVAFVAAGLIMNLLPFETNGHTEILSAIHLPIALWLAIGYAYTGGQWRTHDLRMNFIRFSGEWFI
jgi:hypothetical protein